jgi:outer membrane lipase/esterase
MNSPRLIFTCMVSASLLVACGGQGEPETLSKGSFTAVVSFGDSLSDIGSYAPATSLSGTGAPPYFGGKFTTNETSDGSPDANALGKIWVENLASSLGIALTPAEVGFNGVSTKCPAAVVPALAASCTAYGQGGARVTDPHGIGHNADGTGALTVPVVTQIANHLARFSSFRRSDLILVFAGNNDVFIQLDGFAATAAQIQTQLATGTLSVAQANAQLAAAQQSAEGVVRTAAQELVVDVKGQILAKGGIYVAVVNLGDIGDTPFASTLPAPVRTVVTDLVQVFNAALKAGLADQPVRTIDAFTLLKVVSADPARYGFVNNTIPACDPAKISALTAGAVADGSSLFCNATPGAPYNTLRTGADTTTWQFADDVHPTTGGHKAISDTFAAQLKSFGWI